MSGKRTNAPESHPPSAPGEASHPRPCQSFACGKIILCGEHAVVYGQPAIALPVRQLRACVYIEPCERPPYVTVNDLRAAFEVGQTELAPALLPLQEAIRLGWAGKRRTGGGWASGFPQVHITVTSEIPVAAGMGSGAAVSVALLRAMAALRGTDPEPRRISRLAFEVEKLHHGTPSGVDNTVIAHEQPLYYTRTKGLQPLHIQQPLLLLIADSDQRSSTRDMVAGVRAARDEAPSWYDRQFAEMGQLTQQVRECLATGDTAGIGTLLSRNHELLMAIGVSNARLNLLVTVAIDAGALGAKLSGAGGGGVVITLVEPEKANAVREAWMRRAEVRWIFEAEIPPFVP